ncbi:MAG: hypothetical protein KY444_01840 [Gemmatimonadetes bacterium]|nr:hypothetical protein [Gemmatimonadota bacterium]
MIVVHHRRNTRALLAETPTELGVEVDVRSRGDELIIHHDPFVAGEPFTTWIDEYRHGLLILNVKEEGLEERLEGEMRRRGIDQFFFLDQSFPFLVRTARRGERRCAVRVSEWESVDTALALGGMIEWVWVDCFTRFPLDGVDAVRLRDAGLRLCLVSPELQGRTGPGEIAAMRRLLEERGITADAVCTKTPELWR